MKKYLNLIVLSCFLFTNAFAAGVPFKPQTDTIQLGKDASTDDKKFIVNTGDGASNPKIEVDNTIKRFELNRGVDVTGTVTATSSITAAGNVTSSAGNISGVDVNGSGNLGITGTGAIGGNVTIGTGVGANKTITINKGGSNPFIKWDNAASKWKFSNDGSVEKNFGSGSGSSGGINILANESFEDGLGGWTNSGGTFTQLTYTNATDSNLKYARFVASGSGQYVETSLTVVPDFLGSGCQAQIDKYATITDGAWKISVLDSGANVLATQNFNQSGGASIFIATPLLSFPCPNPAATFKVRIESLAAATIDLDLGYGGGNRNTVSVPCRGTTECEDSFSVLVGSTGVIESQTLDWITSCTNPSTGQIECTFKTGLFSVRPSCRVTTTNVNGSFQYSNNHTVSSSLIRVENRRSDSSIAIQGAVSISCQKVAADFSKSTPLSAVTSEQSGWFIDVNIGGANPTVPASNVSTYTEIADASIDMVLNPGSATAKIPCSSTNAATGLTCSTGSESLGINFNPPEAGHFEVCFDLSMFHSGAANTQHDVILQAVQTANSAQTILQEGKSKTHSQVRANTSVASGTFPHSNCGTFYFSDISEKTVRIMYESSISGVPNSSSIWADRSASLGQQDIRIRVTPLTNNVSRPVLTGDQLVIRNTKKPIDYIANVLCSGSSSITYQAGATASSISNISLGICNLAIPSTTFTNFSDVVCTGSYKGAIGSGNIRDVTVEVTSSTNIQVDCAQPSADCVSYTAGIRCTGESP